MPFEFIKLSIEDVVLIRPKRFDDERGFFMETYKKSDFIKAGIDVEFVQYNHSKSSKHVLRGLHYQLNPVAQGKLIRCIRGTVLDVAVDIRKGSPNYGRWVAEILSEDNCHMLYIPTGFAHGFATLSETAELIYACTAEYSPAHERGIIWNDPVLSIDWGIKEPIVSKKDALLPEFLKADNNFSYEVSR